MCGRFVLDVTADQLVSLYGLFAAPEISPHYNIAPSQQVATIRQNIAGDRELVPCKWGLIPSWAKEPSIGYKMINARSETAHEKPSFKQALKKRRCIIPASGFYEWKKEGKEKRPHYFLLRDGGIMSLAGLWEEWISPDGVCNETFAILTTTANTLVQTLHERMPVILQPDAFDLWLNREGNDITPLSELFRPFPSDMITEYAVSQEVNSPRNDYPGCISPVQE